MPADLIRAAEILRDKYHATVELCPDYLEAELIRSVPKEDSASGKYPVILMIEFMYRPDLGRMSVRVREDELEEPTQLLEFRDRTKDYEKNSRIEDLLRRIDEDLC
jgi:hypothetical protein